MNIMLAALIQFKPKKAAFEFNYKQLLSLCEEAIQKGAKILHLPEMCLTGYLWPHKKALTPFLETKEGPTFQKFSALCKAHHVFLAYGYPEIDEDGRCFNSQNLIGPDGELYGHYRKRHLFPADLTWATAGNLPFQSIDSPYGKIGLGICMDLNFDDFVQFHVIAGTAILLLAMNWLDEGGPVLEYWRYRLFPYAAHCLISNRYGSEQHILFCGNSAYIKHNQIVSHLPPTGNGCLLVELK